jgi:glutamate synthase (NADPH/NADH) large chain
MSGGIAYVLDLHPLRINREMVDVDPLDDADEQFLRAVLRSHQAETGSTVAAGLLASWGSALDRFAKVMPKDYKRVLAAASAAEREGRDVNEAVMAAAHG